MEVTEVLKGHTSQETAYVVSDYPYGYTLRCKIRYWLEYKPGYGYRFMSQTTNPKKTFEVWNKPKASTYYNLGVMVLDENLHVTWTGVSFHDSSVKLAEFREKYASGLDETGLGILADLEKYAQMSEARSAQRRAQQ